MIQTHRSPVVVAFVALLLSFCWTTSTISAASSKRGAKSSARKNSKPEKSARASKATDRKSRAETARAKGKNDRRERATRSARDRRDERASAKNDRRTRAKDERRESARDRNDERRGGRKLSRRERLAEARRESERRRREEAARRAEIARQAAIARALAIARQRAADQALRDEAAANIAKDDTTGEDLEIRRVAVDALGNHAGTVVVMDPKTGRVYTAVNQDWALRKGFKPCSTIKLVTGLAGISENVISPLQTVNVSTGSFRLDLTDSLAYSNNTYFQIVGGQVGFDKLMNYAREFGLGQPTGINHAAESPGRLPLIKSGYAVSHMSSHGDDIEITPVQLANMASAIANGGKLLVPHLPRTPQEGTRFKTEIKRDLNVPQEHLRRLVPGMIGTVSYGTGKGAYDPLQTVAGKTGTCIGQGSWLGLFTSYAPVHDPKLAVAVVTRGSGERGRIAAAVAGKIYRGLSHRFASRDANAPLIATDKLAPRPKIDPRAAAIVSDEDKEADAFVVSEADSAAIENYNGTQPSTVKSTMQPAQTRPTNVTTRPAMNPSAGSSISPGSVPPAGTQRPRRVLETTPNP